MLQSEGEMFETQAGKGQVLDLGAQSGLRDPGRLPRGGGTQHTGSNGSWPGDRCALSRRCADS